MGSIWRGLTFLDWVCLIGLNLGLATLFEILGLGFKGGGASNLKKKELKLMDGERQLEFEQQYYVDKDKQIVCAQGRWHWIQ